MYLSGLNFFIVLRLAEHVFVPIEHMWLQTLAEWRQRWIFGLLISTEVRTCLAQVSVMEVQLDIHTHTHTHVL